MKNIYKIIIAITLSLTVFSCSNIENNELQVDDNLKAKASSETTMVEVTSLNSKSNTIAFDLKVTNTKTNTVLPVFHHKFVSTNKNIDLTSNIDKASGIYTIKCKGQILYKMTILNGSIIKKEIIEFDNLKINSLTSSDFPCTIGGMVDCADETINDMNWVEYAFCLASAPACLARVYASCAWENC